VKEKEFHVPLLKQTEVKFQGWVAFFVTKAGINLLGRGLMSKLGIETKGKKFKISLNLLSVQIEDQIPLEVWTRYGNKEGLQIPPIHIDLKTPSETTTQRKQYPIPLEARLGLKPIIKGLLKDGLLQPCMSPLNTLILSDGSYQLAHDLWAINQIVHPKHSVIPNPYTLLSKIPPDH
jgi:hypothetical protein